MHGLSDTQRSPESFDGRVARVAAAQFGVFTRAQVSRFGATDDVVRRRLRTGRWERLARSVYRVAGTPASWHQSLMAACLARAAVVSHHAAAALWRLAGFEPGVIELTVPRRRRAAGPWILHQGDLPSAEVTVVDSIPVTTVARTLLDIAGVVEREKVEEATDDALRRGLVSLPRLRLLVARSARSGRPGIAALRSVIEARDPRAAIPQSVFETKLLRVLVQAGLPRPVSQYRIRSVGRLIAVVDFAFPAARLAVEADGYRWHSGRSRWDHDRERRNELTILGWRVIHVTWTALTRSPDAVTASIQRALSTGPRATPDREGADRPEPL